MGHHYAPQKYLEGFRDLKRHDRPMIWQFDKTTGKSSHASIKNVANEKGFYSDKDEALLAETIERPANVVLGKLRARADISSTERRALVYYIATMLTRVPRARDIRESIAPQAVKESCEEFRRLIREEGRAGMLTTDQVRAHLRDADEFEKRCAVSPPAFVTDQIKNPWPTPRIVELVGNMAWRLVATKGPTLFVTSDDSGSFFHGMGLENPKSELIFPISSEVALHASWQEKPWKGVRSVKQIVVREFNRRIAVGASRFVYSSEPAPWLSKVIQNKVEQLSRIIW